MSVVSSWCDYRVRGASPHTGLWAALEAWQWSISRSPIGVITVRLVPLVFPTGSTQLRARWRLPGVGAWVVDVWWSAPSRVLPALGLPVGTEVGLVLGVQSRPLAEWSAGKFAV